MSSSLQRLTELTLELQKPMDLDAMLQLIVERAAEMLGTDRTSIRLLDASGSRLLAVCRHGRPVHSGGKEEFHLGEGLLGWIAEHCQPILAARAEEDPRFVPRPGMTTRLGSFLGVPLTVDDKCLGVLSAVSSDEGFFTEEHQQNLTLMAGICAPRVESARLKRLARVDPLTGALNRRGFDSQFPQVVAEDGDLVEPLSVALVDLDDFKPINDTHGHDVGDRVLQATARVFVSVLRDSDVVVRWGGEEFLLVLPHVALTTAERIAERARAALESTELDAGETRLHVTASFGVAQRRPGEPRDTLLERADQAMYAAKQAGKNRVHRSE